MKHIPLVLFFVGLAVVLVSCGGPANPKIEAGCVTSVYGETVCYMIVVQHAGRSAYGKWRVQIWLRRLSDDWRCYEIRSERSLSQAIRIGKKRVGLIADRITCRKEIDDEQ